MGKGKSNTDIPINNKRSTSNKPGPVVNQFTVPSGPGHKIKTGIYLDENKMNEISSNAAAQKKIKNDPAQVYKLYGLITEPGSDSIGLMSEEGIGLINENYKG